MRRSWIAFLLLVVTAGSVGAQDWTVVPIGTTGDIRAMECPGSSYHAWLAGAGGFVAQSDVGHTVWTPVDTGTSSDLLSVIEAGAVSVGGVGGVVRSQAYSGPGWVGTGVPGPAQDIVLCSRQNFAAYAVGSSGGIWYSPFLYGGWATQSSGTSLALHACGYSGYAVGDQGTFLRTTDAGVHWTAVPTGTTADLYGLLDGYVNLVAVGAGGTIIKSTDSGLTWSPRASGTHSTLRAIDYSKQGASCEVIVGDGGTVLKSTDAGETWCRLNAGTTANLYAVTTPSNTEYLVAGQGGLLLRTTTGGGSCADPAGVGPAAPARATLTLAGPNPIRAGGEILVQSGRDSRVRVDLIDVGGRIVAGLLDRSMRAGETRSLAIPARGLSQGVYLLAARGDGFYSSRHFIIVR